MRRSGSHATLAVVVSAGAAVVCRGAGTDLGQVADARGDRGQISISRRAAESPCRRATESERTATGAAVGIDEAGLVFVPAWRLRALGRGRGQGRSRHLGRGVGADLWVVRHWSTRSQLPGRLRC